MESKNVQNYRAGHEAFNQRDFDTMTHYADSITWTDHSQGRTFTTPQEFKDDFLAGWIGASPDIRITGPRYIDAGQTVTVQEGKGVIASRSYGRALAGK